MQSSFERNPKVLSRHRWIGVAGLGFIPGFLWGLHVALLLLFLNPELPLRGAFVPGLAAFYGLFMGLGGACIMVVLARGNLPRARRLLPWGLTLAVLLAALLSGSHASKFAFYLPPGINSRLIRAATLVGGMALILFYTSLLHSFNRRAYGIRSKFGYVALCLVSLSVMAERRLAYRAGPVPIRATIPAPALEPPRLLVVGIEGATLDALLPLAEQGRVPFLAEVLRSGATTRLVPLVPYRRLAAWATLATGKWPFRHGITDPRRVRLAPVVGEEELQLFPSGVGFVHWGLLGARFRPVQSSDQRALGLWQLLSRREVGCGLIGWPTPPPMSPELRFALAEGFFSGAPDPLLALPPAVAERARLFQVDRQDLDPVILGRFGNDPPLPVQAALATDRWRQGLSLFLLEQQPETRALFVNLPGLATVSSLYAGGLEAAQLEGSEDPEDQRAAEVLAAYYGQLDTFLQELWQRAGEEGLMAIVSPIGFSKPRGLDRLGRWLTGGDAIEGSTDGAPDGVLMLYGDRVNPGTRLADASTVDLVPTLLYGLGYPVARDLDGKVLTGAFDTRWRLQQPLVFIPTYENLTTLDLP